MAGTNASTSLLCQIAIAMTAIATFAGCTHVQLRKNTLGQATTVHDLLQQQVLDNLAMFVENPDAVPFYAVPKQGTSEVTDRANAQATSTWQRFAAPPLAGQFLYSTLQLPLFAERAAKQNWTLDPISDPRKLELMRCAYQQAISSCGYGSPSMACPDCYERWSRYYTGKSGAQPGTITVTSTCLGGAPCWFCVGCKHEVPKHYPSELVGHYGAVYVWVTMEGRNEFAKLTLAILDYALGSPRTLPTKEVTYWLDSKGHPSTKDEAVTKVKALLTVSDTNQSLLAAPYADSIAGILNANKIPLSALSEFTVLDVLARVKESDRGALEALLLRSGYATQKMLDDARKELAKIDSSIKLHGLDSPKTTRLIEELNTAVPELRRPLQLTPTPIESERSQDRGLPPLLQLNQLLETVR